MNFSRALLICFLLHRRALSSEGSFLSEKNLMNEDDLLLKLFPTIKHWIERLPEMQDLMVIGASNDQLQQTKFLLEAFVSLVAKDVTKICTAQRFAKDVIIIYFLSSLEREYITEVMADLATCKRSKLFIIFEGSEASVSDIEFVFFNKREDTDQKRVFIQHSKYSLRLYDSHFTTDCLWKARLFLERMPGDDPNQKRTTLFRRAKVDGCTFAIGVAHRPPWLNLAEDESGATRIIGGVEGRLISTIAQKMNFTIQLQKFEYSGNSRGSHRVNPMISGCAARKLQICIGHIRPKIVFMDSVEISVTYGHEFVVWHVPGITHEKSNIVTSEFSWSSWLLIGLIFLASFWIDRIVRRSHPLNRGNADRSGCCLIILDFIGSTLGSPTIYNPVSIGGKLLLVSYLLYSTVITTAYKTSLSSIMMVENSVPSIHDAEGIIMANLTTAGNINALGFLEDQRGEDKSIPELIRRFEIELNTTRGLLRVSNDKDFAYLTSTTNFLHHKRLLAKAGEFISVYTLKNYVLYYGVVMVFPKSSFMKYQINVIIQCLSDSGILKHWMDYYDYYVQYVEKIETNERLRGFTWNKFYLIFRIYCLALIFCIFTFFGELIVCKFKFAETVRRFKNSIRVKVRRGIPL